MCYLFLHLALDVTANCICKIQHLALDGLDPNSALKLSRKDKKSQPSQDSNLGLLGEKQECYAAPLTFSAQVELKQTWIILSLKLSSGNGCKPEPS